MSGLLCGCGCGGVITTTNFRGKYARFLCGHYIRPTRESLVAKFWGLVEKTDGCWLWRGPLFDRRKYGSYGAFRLDGETRAHRVAWILANATVIPKGMIVMHTCDEPQCVRPDHLVLGTLKDNTQDSIAKGRRPHQTDVARLAKSIARYKHLTQADVLAIRSVPKRLQHGQAARLAADFGVTVAVIKNIRKRSTHAWVDGPPTPTR